MSFITSQQAKLDLELVPKEKRLEVEKCNGRLNLGKIQREPTFQVVLDALALTSCYPAFLITVDVPEVDILKIYPKVQGQDFDALPTDEDIVSFLRELGHTREINLLNDVVTGHMHQPWRTFVSLINRSLSGKTTEATQIYGKLLPESLTNPEIKETKAYKTYLGCATGATCCELNDYILSTVKTEVSTANTILVLLKAKESIIVWDPQVVSELGSETLV
nr:hypothetical protein [Tanacetum cinerariifolium]